MSAVWEKVLPLCFTHILRVLYCLDCWSNMYNTCHTTSARPQEQMNVAMNVSSDNESIGFLTPTGPSSQDRSATRPPLFSSTEIRRGPVYHQLLAEGVPEPVAYNRQYICLVLQLANSVLLEHDEWNSRWLKTQEVRMNCIRIPIFLQYRVVNNRKQSHTCIHVYFRMLLSLSRTHRL